MSSFSNIIYRCGWVGGGGGGGNTPKIISEAKHRSVTREAKLKSTYRDTLDSYLTFEN